MMRTVQRSISLQRRAIDICKRKYASKSSSSAKPSEFAQHLGIAAGKLPKNYFEDHPESKKQLLEWIGAQMNVVNKHDWYQVQTGQLARQDPSMARLLRDYNDSLYELLKDNYPEHDWQPWKFAIVPRSHSKAHADRRRFFEWVAGELKLTDLDGWYAVSTKQIVDFGGQQLLIHFRGNLFDALSDAYPEHKFVPWRFAQVRKGFWKDPASLRAFLDWAAPQLGIQPQNQKLDEWYSITPGKLSKLGGASIFNEYGSMFEVVSRAFPEHTWHEWLFEFVPRGFWANINNVRRYFEWIRTEDLPKRHPTTEPKTGSLEILYKLTREDLIRTGGLTMIQKQFRGSLIAALRAAYPTEQWHEFQFDRARNETWSTLKKQREFLETVVAPHLGVRTLSDWYGVTSVQLSDPKIPGGGGRKLLTHYHDSPSKLFTTVFPEHTWELWRFAHVPHKFWTTQLTRGDYTALRALMTQKVGPALGITQLEDWTRISGRDLRAQGVEGVVTLFGGLHSVLSHCFPDHNWDKISHRKNRKSGYTKKSAQRRLKRALEELFPGKTIEEEMESGVGTPDLCIPEIGLGVEFLGEHHYRDLLNTVGLAEAKSELDIQKAAALQALALEKVRTLVYVPYWWDGRASTLANTIRSVRPDLFPDQVGDGKAISEKDPNSLEN